MTDEAQLTDAHDADRATLDELTQTRLLELARDRDVEGRSTMSKEQLVEALLSGDGDDGRADGVPQTGEAQRPAGSRFEAFRELAEARARGEMVFLPRLLTGQDRRIHVRQTVREDHQVRIANHDSEAEAKFDKLAGSLFSFFRGTCLLFYRDMAGEDAWMPTVLTLGDVHPENFGVMPSYDNVPIFGSNDFDEAFYAPFTWDLKRGATGFVIAADEIGGHGAKRAAKIVRAFVNGYIDALRSYAGSGNEHHEQIRQDNGPELVSTLIDGALQSRADWLERKYLDEYKRGFRPDDEHVPVSHRREEFQEALDRFVADSNVEVPERTPGMKVKDVCMRLGQGTASLGLPRYYLLVEGPNADGTDDVIIEFKQARRSALAGLVPPSDFVLDGTAERISHAQGVHLVRGDRFYGAVELDGLSFMVRERAPYREKIDLGGLSKQEWSTYAAICGRSLAHSHAMSDESGLLDYDVEPAILAAIGADALFVDDIVGFSAEAAHRIRIDHEHFRGDHRLGAFRSIDHVFR
ncbi:hypothetical protein BH09ACT12_BH09ACT12_10990 [soil metagenome]